MSAATSASRGISRSIQAAASSRGSRPTSDRASATDHQSGTTAATSASPARAGAGRRGPRGPARAEGRSGRNARATGSSERAYASRTRGGRGRRAPCGARRRRRRPPRRASIGPMVSQSRRGERERRRRIVLEAEPAVLRELLDAMEVLPGARLRGARRTGWSGRTPPPRGRGPPPTRRQAPIPATTRGTSSTAPGYFADAASPAARPAHSSRPETSSASVTVTPSIRRRP